MERINWKLPLETDEETPRRAMLGMAQVSGGPVAVMIGFAQFQYEQDGRPLGMSPTLRNVRTVDTSRDDAFRRMEALVRRMAGVPLSQSSDYVEAREIVKLLPAPSVDPLLIEARKLVTECVPEKTPPGYYYDSSDYTQIALAGLKRGAELAHGEYTLGPPPGPNDDFLTYRRQVRPVA